VQFDRSFGCFVLSPIKQGQAQADCGRIQKKDLGLDPELYLLKTCLLSQTFQQYEIIGFEDVEIPVLVLIAHAGFRGRFPDTQMIEIACGRTQTVTDIAYRLAFGELAEQHGYHMSPASVPLVVLI